MAKVSVVERDKKRRHLANKYYKRREVLKNIVNDPNSSIEDRFEASLSLSKLPRNSSKVRTRLRCSITGRGRGNYRMFGLCRIKFRELASRGDIPGIIKSSW